MWIIREFEQVNAVNFVRRVKYTGIYGIRICCEYVVNTLRSITLLLMPEMGL